MNAPECQLRATQERGSTQQQEQHDQHETQPTSGMHRSDLQFEDVCYPFWIGSRCTDEIAQHLASMSPSSLHIVTDETVNALHVRPLARRLQEFARVRVWPIAVGEKSKSLRTLERLAHDVLEARIDRQGVVVAMGGGVVGNVAGLLAALLFRGIRLVHVPTTLMAMSDSVISLKQAVNMPQGKNLIGCFHTPAAVFADTAYLLTLPAVHLRSGRHHGRQHPFDIPPEYVDVNIYSQHQGQADYEAALKTVSALVDMDPAQSTPEGDQLEILAILVEKYETEHFPMAAPVRRGHACIRRPCPLRGRRLPSFRRA